MEEENAIRLEPLGLDRRHNRYWRVTAASARGGDAGPGGSSDPNTGRVYVEAADGSRWVLGGLGSARALRWQEQPTRHVQGGSRGAGDGSAVPPTCLRMLDPCSWRLLSKAEQIEALMSVLEPKGAREVRPAPGSWGLAVSLLWLHGD